MENTISRWTVVVLSTLLLSACAVGYNKDTPYDPDFRNGEALFDQIPNNTNGSSSVCAGHLDPKDRLPHQTGRC